MKRNGLPRTLGMLALCFAGVAVQAQQQSGFSLTLVGNNYPNDLSRQFGVSDISDRGDVAGARGLPNGDSIAFIWRNGVFRELNAQLSATSAGGPAINDTRDVAGLWWDAQSNQSHSYLLRSTGQLTEIAAQGQTILGPRDMNNRRQVLLLLNGATGFARAVWQQGRPLALLEPLPGSMSTDFRRLNDLGVVVGTATFATRSNAVLWQDGTIMPLPRPKGSSYVDGIDITNDGTVLMNAIFPAAPARSTVVLWKEGTLTALKPYHGLTWADASDIGNNNVIVGRSYNGPSAADMTATIWRAGIPSDLNLRVLSNDPLKPFVHLQWGLLISDWGYIVARGVDSRYTDGRVGLYLLTPH